METEYTAYAEAVAFLEQSAAKGMVFGLETMRNLLDRIGNPQEKMDFIQVAGTNGKGSVTAYLSQILSQAGYKTGRYTSPAVFFPEEIIQTGKQGQMAPIGKQAVVQGVELLRKAVSDMQTEGLPLPTRFELETALAFWYFAREGCQIAVIEAGLGGDLDATNVVERTICSVLVSISFDHRQILGNTLEEIAAHKAGIIKPGRPGVLMKQSREVEEQVQKICQGQNSPLIITRPCDSRVIESTIAGMIFDYKEWEQVEIQLAGVFQKDNAMVVLDTIQALRQSGYFISDQAVYQGMRQTLWPGRMQVLKKEPLVLLDGAHNPDAAEKLVQSLENYFTNERFLYIMGVLADKEYPKVIEILQRNAAGFVTLTPKNSRGLSAEVLAGMIEEKIGQKGQAAASIEEAAETARRQWKAGEKIIVCGSLSFLGEFQKLWQAV